jgi:peptide/nickel transport system permease protein
MSVVIRIVIQRLALGLLTLLAISVLIFGAVELLPGDVAEEVLGQNATPETVAAYRTRLGLDRPPVERYFKWLGDALRGDFGESLVSGRPIAELIGDRLGATAFLAGLSALIAVPLALGLGILAALWRNSLFDRTVNVATLTSISFPEFFVAYILIYVLAQSGLFPSMSNITPGMDLGERIWRSALPAFTLTLVVTAHMMRMTRAAIINLLASQYVEMARLKGVPPALVILRHALPNAIAPIVNVVALNLAWLVTGVVVVEVVFVYPGLGQLLVDSVAKRDMTVVQAACLLFAVVYVLLNLAADVIGILSNPRLRRSR